ncbi:nucleoside deaminase [Falsochrobactrum tianjinense]|nr:nucleoside deaminase [Falsochrobactrum sp. TDYN1]
MFGRYLKIPVQITICMCEKSYFIGRAMISNADQKYLQRCVDLAAEALAKGDEPFGSVLVSAEGEVLFEDHNRVSGGDHTQHPEFAIARWAAQNMSASERAKATVYTSGEHCPMCAAAHGWVGLGRIVYASSSKQLSKWLSELGMPPSPVRALSIGEVINDAVTEGPVEEFKDQVHRLHILYRTT